MSMLTRNERLALLLTLLGDEAADLARSGLHGDALEELESALRDFDEYPPSQAEINLVVEDFESYFHMALDSADKTGEDGVGEGDQDDDGPAILQIPEEHFDVDLEPTRKFELPSLTGNTSVDLHRAHPYQVAHALAQESPAVTALVIGSLANEYAAKTLEFLPETTRAGVFLKLADPPGVRPIIAERVLSTVLERALKVEERQTEEESSEKMACLMRSLPRALRTPMMEELARNDEAMAEAVKKRLYRFEDLEKLDDRDLQKFLGQCGTDTLVVALQQVEASLLDRVLGNMSKRAKEALTEEMEFKANAKMEEIDAGRAEVVTLLVELVESGAVSLD